MNTKTTKICSAPCVQLIGDDGKMFCEAVKHQYHQSDVIHVYVYPAGNGAKTVIHIMGHLREQKVGDPELVKDDKREEPEYILDGGEVREV